MKKIFKKFVCINLEKLYFPRCLTYFSLIYTLEQLKSKIFVFTDSNLVLWDLITQSDLWKT